MIFGVSLSLIGVYAIYRMNEYYMIRQFRSMSTAPPGTYVFSRTGRVILSLFLLPARLFGWVFLVYFGFRHGWLRPVVLIAVAFPLSLLLQMVPVWILRRSIHSPEQLDGLMTVAGFVVLPVCALLLIFLLPPT